MGHPVPTDGRMRAFDRYMGKGRDQRGVWDLIVPTHKVADIGNMRALAMEHVQDLATSMKKDGQQMPILVNRRRLDGGAVIYERIDGEHRWRACIINGSRVWATVFDNLQPLEVMERMLSANIHRDPESLEWANKIQQNYEYWCLERLGDGTVAGYSRQTGISAARVHNAIRVLGNLDDRILELHKQGQILWGTIVELARLDDHDLQYAWAVESINADLSSSTMRRRVSIHLQTQQNGKLALGGLWGKGYSDYRETQRMIDPILEKATLHYVEWLSRMIFLIRKGHQTSRVLSPKRVQALLALEEAILWLKSMVPAPDDSTKDGDN